MSCSIVRIWHLRSPVAHARYSIVEQQLIGHAPRARRRTTPLRFKSGPDFIPSEPEAAT